MTPSDLYQAEIELGEIRPDPVQHRALTALDRLHYQALQPRRRQWWHRLIAPPAVVPDRGVYMWGGVGTGKTLLMDLFYSSLPNGIGKRIHFHRFMQSVHDRRADIKDQQSPLRIIAGEFADRHRVLCLDEFAVTDITDAMLLYGLLEALFARGVSLVTTSNIPQKELYKDGLQRARFLPAIELLEKHTEQVQVDGGEDYRMAFLKSDSIYHTPLDPAAAQALERSFAALGGHHEDSKTSIVLCGREVAVVKTGSGTIWFEFAVLCEGHRSKLDYIELAKRFHTVIVANIPLLNDDRNDATRRFIELVDELYDRGVNLITSAAGPAESLYGGKRLAQPFKRTASRLREMTSLDYLSRPHLP